MTLPAALFAIRWLVRDTIRQSLANGVFWLMLAITAVCAAVCLTVSTVQLPQRPTDEVAERLPASEIRQLTPEQRRAEGIDVIEGEVTLLFGAIRIPWTNYRENAVRYLQTILLGVVADTGGILLALIWTAGFLPSFLDPGSASVLLAKPIPRWSLLAGKYLGVLVLMGLQATLFVGSVWLALGLRTGIWDGTCFLALPVLLFHFAVFFSFSTLLAVTTRSTVACVLGSLVFWFVCLGMNLGRHHALLLPELESASRLFGFLVDAGYWMLPKPADLGALLVDALQIEGDVGRTFDVAALEAKGAWQPTLSVLSSGLAAIVLLSLAAYEFVTQEY